MLGLSGGGGSAPSGGIFSGAAKAMSNVGSTARKVGKTTAKSSRRSSSSSSGRRSSGSYRAPRPAGYSAPRPAVGNSRTGSIAPASPPPTVKPMTLDQYLAGDTAYKTQKSAYENALRDYAAQYQNEQNKYSGEYDATVKKLGTDRTNAQTALQDDYASRGLMTSGVYADALNNFQSEWDTKQADLQRAKEAYMNDLLTGKTNYEKEQQLLLEQAKQAAANRYSDSRSVF